MSYLDTYFSRINHLGNSTSERIRNSGIRSFIKWLSESPHTVRQLSIERGLYFDGIILTQKDKEYEKIMLLNVANDIKLQVGDILNWTIDDGSVEKWILIQEEKKVNGTYRTFWIIRCNYLIKWINNEGHLQQSWCYFVSSLDSKIKGNYRTWHNLISPQPNKYAEILMPYYNIERATNFIVENESWAVIEYDHSSVPGTIYLSLTENKVNIYYDDLENKIADTDKRAKYTLNAPSEPQHFKKGEKINLSFTVLKNGEIFKQSSDETIIYTSLNPNIVKVINGELYAVNAGEATININFPEYTDIDPQVLSLQIIIENEDIISHLYYIDGPDFIRTTKSAIYTIKDNLDNLIDNITLEVDKDNFITIEKQSIGEYLIIANSENRIDTIDGINITVKENNTHTVIATKNIKILPLW